MVVSERMASVRLSIGTVFFIAFRKSLYMKDYITQGDFGRGNAKVRGIFGNPILRLLDAIVDAGAVLADCHRESAFLVASDRIADQAFDRTHKVLQFSRPLFEQVQ